MTQLQFNFIWSGTQLYGFIIWPEFNIQVQTHDLRNSPQYNFLMLCIYSMQYVKHISTKLSLIS